MAWNLAEITDSILAKLQSRRTPVDQLSYLQTYHSAAVGGFSIKYAKRFPQAEFLGMGGSGVVLKLCGVSADGNDPAKVLLTASTPAPRCLKYPHPCVGLPGDFSLTEVIDNEAERLAQISHRHIMPLEETVCIELSESTVAPRDRRVPAYLMPFIPSADLSEYLAKPEATGEELIVLLQQAADAIAYLHSRELVHLDIKPANILVAVDAPGEVRALVSDFGFCKRAVVDSHETLVMGTDGYMDPDLLALMSKPTSSNENRIRDRVPRSELQPQFDRYAFGATILDSIGNFLGVNTPDGNPRTMPTSLLRGLLFVALKCAGRNPVAMRTHAKYPNRQIAAPKELFRPELADAFVYKSSDDLTEDLARLGGNRLPFLEPEVAETTGEVVCLPERMFVPLSKRVIRTIDSVLVRRLATVTQLAL